MAANKTTILISARDQASKAFGRVAKNSTQAQKKIFGVNSALKSTDKSMVSLSKSLKGLAGGLAAGLGLNVLAGVVKEAISVKIEFDKINNTLKAVTGSSQSAADEMRFLTSEAERLGLELRPLAQSYTRLAASGKLLGLTTDSTREIFTSFSEALTGFGASREQSIRVFTAIEQILSKGKVSAEELRQQLGEALPGSFQLAARAAGVTVQELDGMLKRGELLSSEFILPFAKAVRNEFGGAAVEGAKLLNAEFSRTINVLEKVKLAFTEGGRQGNTLTDSIAKALKEVRTFLDDEERLKRIGEWGQALGEGLLVAAKAMTSIANVLSKIPTEALLAVGALALGSRGGSKGGLKEAVASVVATQPVTQAFSATRANRNFLNPVRQGGINDSNLGSVRGVLGAREGYISGSEVARRERRNAWRREHSRPRSKFPGANLSQTLITPSRAFSGQFGQEKIAKSFEKSMVGAATAARKTLVGTIGKALAPLGRVVLSVVTPFNLLAVAIPSLISALYEWRNQTAKIVDKTFEGRRSEAFTKGTQVVREFRESGAGVVGTNAREILNSVAEGMEEVVPITDALVKSFAEWIEKGNKVKQDLKEQATTRSAAAKEALEAIKYRFQVVRERSQAETKDLGRQAELLSRVGIEKAKEIELARAYFQKLKEENISRKEALELTKKYVDALRKRKEAEKKEGAKKASGEFGKETDRIKENNELRKKGFTEEQIARRNRFNSYVEELRKQGVAEEQARKQALERTQAEDKKKALSEPIAIERRSSAVGTATKARSVDAALKKQQRQEDQRFTILKAAAENTANSVENIAEIMSQFNTSFN